MRSSRLLLIGCILAAGSLASLLCHLLLPATMTTAWRDGVTIALGWFVVFLLTWRLKLGHEDIWWWPFAAPRGKDDEEP